MRQHWTLAVLGMVLAAALIGCGSEEATPAVEAPPTSPFRATTTTDAGPRTTEPKTSSVPVLEDLDVVEEEGAEAIAVLRQYVEYNGVGDDAGMRSLMSPELAATPYVASISIAGFWSWMSQYDTEYLSEIECAFRDGQAVCSHLGTDTISRALDYRFETTWHATVEDGRISELLVLPSDGGVWGAFFPWMAETYPDIGACTADSEFASEGGPVDGLLAEDWIDECVAFMESVAPEFGKSSSYVAPPEVG